MKQAPVTIVHPERPKKLLRPPSRYQDLVDMLVTSYNFGSVEELIYLDEDNEECLIDDDASLQIALERSPLQGLTIYLRQKGAARKKPEEQQVVLMTIPAKFNRAYIFSSAHMELRKVISDYFVGSARVALRGETAIITGGMNQLRQVVELELGLMEARKLQPLLFGRFWHGIAAIDDHLFVSGGKDDEDRPPLSTCELFDGESWTELPSLNISRDSHTMVGYMSSVYVFGGEDDENRALTSIEKLQGSRWTNLTIRLPAPRTMPGIVFLSEECVLMLGGMQGGEKANTFRLSMKNGDYEELGKLPIAARFPSNPTACVESVVYALDNSSIKVFALDLATGEWREAEVVRPNIG